MSLESIQVVWDDYAKQDLKDAFEFNRDTFSEEFAEKVKEEILDTVSNITYVKQWGYDNILGKPYRRILVRHFKIVYLVKDEKTIYILKIFDGRKDPNEMKENL